jgi:hypothetical protein
VRLGQAEKQDCCDNIRLFSAPNLKVEMMQTEADCGGFDHVLDGLSPEVMRQFAAMSMNPGAWNALGKRWVLHTPARRCLAISVCLSECVGSQYSHRVAGSAAGSSKYLARVAQSRCIVLAQIINLLSRVSVPMDGDGTRLRLRTHSGSQ